MGDFDWPRRRLVKMLGAAPLAALGRKVRPWRLAADETGAGPPVRGGTLDFGVHAGDPPSYDCHASAVFTLIHLLTPHYSNLLKIDMANYPRVVGDLAQSWEMAPDAKSYTFKLHQGVKFHDGSAFTAADVKASYDRIRNPPPGVVSLRQGLVADVETIETPDPLTVVFRLRQSNRAMVYAFANPFNAVYSAAKLAEDPNFPAHTVLGTGPFRFVEHVAGSHWRGERFPDYFKPGLPYLDGFRAVFLPGPAMVNALQGGQVLADFRGLPPGERDRLVQSLGTKIVVQESPWLDSLLLMFNSEKKPFDDARVRRALSLAIDRWQASEALQRFSILRFVGGYLRPGYALAASEADLLTMPGFARDIAASRAEARRLLTEAGADGLKVKLLNRNLNDPFLNAGVFIIDQWRQIGVETEHQQVNDTVWSATTNDGSFEVALDFQGDTIDEPDYQLPRYLSKDLSSNRARYTDRALDALFQAQHDAGDDTARYHALRAFEMHLSSQAYIVPFLWWNRIVVRSARIEGWHMSPSHLIGQDLETAWLKP